MKAGVSANGAQPRLAVLDGIRILAALAVAFYHYTALESAWGKPTDSVFPDAHRFAVYGWLGVEVFFLVSGFVICMSAWGRTVGDFAASRFARLFPAYWAGIIVTSVTLFTWPEVRKLPVLSDVVVNLSMLQGGLRIPHIDDVYWTLFVELKFYVLFAVVVMCGVTYRNCVLFCGLWTISGVVSATADSGLLSFFAFPSFSPYFIAGIAFYLMRRFRPSAVLWAIVGIQFVLAQQYVRARMVSNLGSAIAERTPAWPAHALITLGFVVMAACALGALDAVRWRWLPYAGALTYPFYLIHMMAGLTLIHRFRGQVPPVALVLGVTALMLALSWAIHRLVEKPLGPRLRRALHRGIQDIRVHSLSRSPLPRIPAQACAPEAERTSSLQREPSGRP
ncbi:acyltransferase family protein [Streptomyces sp. NPDC054838]